ncbi:MAG: hypothetical protein IPJ60_15145 [Sphingobacteriaceae bacterium]|nr:hypothetical protein [Sphingobacteriaceae bacterium]
MGRFPYYIILLIMAFQANAQYMHYSVKDGDTINIVDRDSLRQGVWRTYYSTGKFKAEVVYKNSKKQGIEIQWHNNLSNCVKQEAFYNNGVLDGPITYYSKNCKRN